jgi:hypothetical protein
MPTKKKGWWASMSQLHKLRSREGGLAQKLVVDSMPTIECLFYPASADAVRTNDWVGALDHSKIIDNTM